MLKIRLRRIGKNNRPYFAVVVADHKKAVKGKFIEKLGSYDPIKKSLSVNAEKIEEWRKKGAQLSDTVHNLLVKNKILKAKPIKKTVKPKQKIKETEKEPKNQPKADQPLAGEIEKSQPKIDRPLNETKKSIESQESKKSIKVTKPIKENKQKSESPDKK